jgi:hypothetical protein
MSDKLIEVLEIGSSVVIDGEIPATVTGINIRGVEHRLQYEVTWWDERTRKSEWVEPYEVKAKQVHRRSLKFA